MSNAVLARALARSQHGPEVLATVAAVSSVLALIGLQSVPTLDHGYPLHLFTLGPGVIAAVSSVAAISKLTELNVAVDRRLMAFRGTWCVSVALMSGLLVWAAAAAMSRPEIVRSTILLVGLTFAAHAVVHSAAWCVGALNTVAAMALPRAFGDSDPVTALLRSCGAEAWLVVGMGVLLCAAFYAVVDWNGALPRWRNALWLPRLWI